MAHECVHAGGTLRRATRAVTAACDAALTPRVWLAAEAALDRSTMGRNLNPLERRGLVRIEVWNVDQRERVAHLTAAGEARARARRRWADGRSETCSRPCGP
jgi:DNA-binding MarR family transcriptional regulator